MLMVSFMQPASKTELHPGEFAAAPRFVHGILAADTALLQWCPARKNTAARPPAQNTVHATTFPASSCPQRTALAVSIHTMLYECGETELMHRHPMCPSSPTRASNMQHSAAEADRGVTGSKADVPGQHSSSCCHLSMQQPEDWQNITSQNSLHVRVS